MSINQKVYVHDLEYNIVGYHDGGETMELEYCGGHTVRLATKSVIYHNAAYWWSKLRQL